MGKGNKLFGLHIGKLVYNAIKAAGDVLPLTLIRVTPGVWNSAAPLAGTNPTSASHAAKGFSNDKDVLRYGHGNIPDDILSTLVTEIFVFNATMPEGVEPASSDRINFLGHTWHVGNVKTDPAKALWICTCRGGA